MPLDVCLIRSPVFVARRSLSYFDAVPPIGLAYVAAAMREAGHSVSVIDAAGEGLDQLWAFPRPDSPIIGRGLGLEAVLARVPTNSDVIGITCTFLHEWPFVCRVAQAIKARHPRVTLIVGGETPTGMGAAALRDEPAIDVIVRGEGEHKALALLAALEEGRALDEVPGLIVRVQGEVHFTPDAPRIRDVDSLPRPAWDLFPVERYLEHGAMSGVNRGRSMPLLSSRGCPFECTFCSSPAMWTTRYHARAPEAVVSEIAWLQERYDVRNVDFYDLTAVLTPRWVERFHDVVETRGLQFTWQIPAGTRSEALQRRTLELMYETGCRNLTYAIESASPRILREMKKRVDVEKLVGSVCEAIDIGIIAHCNFIIGYPSETLADHWRYLKLTVRLAWLGAYSVAPMVFSPYPGSAEFELFEHEGKIDFRDEGYLFGSLLRASAARRASFHPRFSIAYLMALQLGFVVLFWGVQFARRPQRALALVVNLVRGRHETTLEQFLSSRMRQVGATR